MEDKIKKRIEQLLAERTRLITAVEKQIFGIDAVIGELQALLVPDPKLADEIGKPITPPQD